MNYSRVTSSSITAGSLANLELALSRYQTAENTATTGRRINQPSDGPSDASRAMGTRTELARQAQYARNADSGMGYLNTADQALQSTLTSLDRARDLVLQAQNTGAGTAGDSAASQEVSSLRDSVLALANTTFDGTPIFAGASGTTSAYAANGTYQGDAGALERQVGPGQRVPVTLAGPAAFGPPGSDAMSVLARVAADMASGAGVSASDLQAIDAVRATVTSALTSVGTVTNRLTAAKTAATDTTLTLTSSLSDIEDVDAPTALIALQSQQLAYQSALAATGKIMQTSLLDFLK